MTNANVTSGTVWTGDNLPILRGMNAHCVDFIDWDPPFNSNRNHEVPIGSQAAGASFKDAWTLDDVDVKPIPTNNSAQAERRIRLIHTMRHAYHAPSCASTPVYNSLTLL